AHRKHRRFGGRDRLAVNAEKNIQRANAAGVAGASGMNVLGDPSGTVSSFRPAKAHTNREAARYTTDRLMKKSRMASPELSNEIMHRELKFLGIAQGNDARSRFLGETGPIGPVESRIKILLRDGRRRLVEYFSALRGAQISRM